MPSCSAALRRMEAAELAEELEQFHGAFAGGRERPEPGRVIRGQPSNQCTIKWPFRAGESPFDGAGAIA